MANIFITPLCFMFIIKFTLATTPLISRKDFLSTSDYSSIALSHDGKHLAYVAPNVESDLTVVRNIYIKQLPNGQPKQLTYDKVDSIRYCEFAYDNKTIFFMTDPDGDENYSLHSVDINTGKITDIENDENVQAFVWESSPDRPSEVVLKINKRNPAYHDAFLYNIETGDKKLIFENDMYANLLFNHNLQPVLAYNQTDDAGQLFFRLLSDGRSVELIKKSPPDTRDTTAPVNVDATGTSYWLDNDFNDKVEFVAMDSSGQKRQVLYSPKKADVESGTFHPVTGRPLWLYENYQKSQIVHFDDSFKSDFTCLQQRLPKGSTVTVSGLSLDMMQWLVIAQLDTAPASYYLYNRTNRSVQFLLSAKEKLARQRLASTYPVEIGTSDGLTQVCYVVVPVDYDQSKNGIPSQPLPTILFVHGGPHGRDNWEYDQYPQYLANRNYVVIKCNYRASIGYGKAFLNAGNGQWGKKMQQDLTDAVHWAIERKVADPAKVAIAGYSYGGYATLAGLTFTPDLYACGVDIVGPSNLITLLQTIPPYWKPLLEAVKISMGGDIDTEEGREKLRQSSPVFFVDKIKKPLLIGQGANDPRVKQAESDQIFEALKNSSVPVTYVLFSNEGHGFSHQENDLAFWAIAEKFLGDCLGGRVEPITDEIEKSTAKVQSYNTNP